MATTRQHTTAVASPEGLTVIGPRLHVNGRVEGEEDLRIEGRVEGSITLSETLHVAEGGIVAAKVTARDVVVSGIVIGNVTATNSVTLNPGAKLVGDISAPRLIIADGAAFRGNVAMNGEAPAPVLRTAARARPRPVLATRPAAAAPTRAARAAQPAKEPAREPSKEPARAPAAEAPATRPAPPRKVAIAAPAGHDDEVTVVVRHAALATGAADADGKAAARKKTKKSPPRARVPKPGKRRVGRR
jgi:cytoskeletal protein CcmA (bactofilin family)